MRSILYRLVPLVLALLALAAQAADGQRNLAVTRADASPTQRVALVIGNGRYAGAPLRNPANDAHDMAAALRRLGFDVIEKTDVGQKDMNRAITQFGAKLTASSIAVFFYAGHGVQVKGKNYLIPVDAQIVSEASVRSETVDVDAVLDQLSASPLNVVILDACRNNPFESKFRSVGGGLAQMDAPKGTLIAYATAPGKVASDGEARNGMYTQELLKLIQTPGLQVESVFKRVRANVARATGDNQIPWESSSLTGDFYFRTPVGEPAGTADPARMPGAAADPVAVELAYWDGVKGSNDPRSFQAYLDEYPGGRFVALARIRAKELGDAQAAARGPQRTSRTDFLEATWEADIAGNAFQMRVVWNPSTEQYEGILARQGDGSASVGFSLGETIWKAKPTADPGRLHENQMMRTGAFGLSTGFKWLEGELNLDRCSADELVTSFARFHRVRDEARRAPGKY